MQTFFFIKKHLVKNKARYCNKRFNKIQCKVWDLYFAGVFLLKLKKAQVETEKIDKTLQKIDTILRRKSQCNRDCTITVVPEKWCAPKYPNELFV